MGFSRQEYWSGLPFPSPVDHILSDLSTMTRPSWVAPGAWLSFTELDKSVVLVWLDWLVFCEYGFRVSALWCPLASDRLIWWAFSRCESSWGLAWGKGKFPQDCSFTHVGKSLPVVTWHKSNNPVHCTKYMSGHPKLGLSVLGLSTSFVMFVKSDQCSEY